MRFKYQGHILRPIEGSGPSPAGPLTCTFTGSGANNKGPVNAVEFINSNWNHGTPVNHQGYCIITGVKR